MKDNYKIANYIERLEKESLEHNRHLKMIYMWVKQESITFGEFEELISYCNKTLKTKI